MSDHGQIHSTKLQDLIERKTLLMFIITALTVAVGGIVEIVPLFYLPNTAMCQNDPTCNGTSHKDLQGNHIPMDKIIWNPETSAHKTLDTWVPGDGVRPYKPLELAGR
jgi:cytochrome c oxidase cbb3-type subunit 2